MSWTQYDSRSHQQMLQGILFLEKCLGMLTSMVLSFESQLVSVYLEWNKVEGLSSDGAFTKTLFGEWAPPSRTLSSDGCLSGCWGGRTLSYSTCNRRIALTCSSVMLKHVDPQLWVFGAHSKPEFGINLHLFAWKFSAFQQDSLLGDSERISIVPQV